MLFRRTLCNLLIICSIKVISASPAPDVATCTRPLVSHHCSFDNCGRVQAYARACSFWADQGHVLVYRPLTSVGNLMLALHQVYVLAEELAVALVVAVENFPALALMLEPNLIPWHVLDYKRGKGELLCKSGTSRFVFMDGHVCAPLYANVTKPHIIQQLATGGNLLKDVAAKHELSWLSATALHLGQDTGCLLRAMFRRTVAAEAYAVAQAQTWKSRLPGRYVAWHIRTGVGERPDYNITSALYAYIHLEPPDQLCEMYQAATAESLSQLPVEPDTGGVATVYLSTNSKQVQIACAALAAQLNITLIYSDFGLLEGAMHTETNLGPVAGMHALLDWLFLIDSTFLATSGSSFALTALQARDMHCATHHAASKLRARGEIIVCRSLR